ncbi:AraC family transcriptional regulator [Paenibacillus sp. GCM10027626]|uniref:AraC family transcriptional regulator n=1 Tax=Paenibacillus sp. GCM10027626 TaxID=3273411 RepID=UPI00363B082B
MKSKYDKHDVIKLEGPRNKTACYWPEEIRFELPFPVYYDRFLYISKFWYEKWYTPTQFHDHFELCYVCEGEGWFILEGMMFPVKKGDIFVTKPGEIHCGGAVVNAPFLVYAVGFRFEQMAELEKEYYKLSIQRISNDSDEVVRPFLDNIMNEIEADSAYAHLMVRSYMSAMLTIIFRIYERHHGLTKEKTKSLTPEMMHVLNLVHMDMNFMGKIDKIAKRVNMSRSNLDREFKSQMGVALGEYVRGVWVERAKQLLIQSSESITSISEKLHFDSVQAFSMFFKRQLGLSPQAFKRRINVDEMQVSDKLKS